MLFDHVVHSKEKTKRILGMVTQPNRHPYPTEGCGAHWCVCVYNQKLTVLAVASDTGGSIDLPSSGG